MRISNSKGGGHFNIRASKLEVAELIGKLSACLVDLEKNPNETQTITAVNPLTAGLEGNERDIPAALFFIVHK
jgi:hypothetical protein